MENKIPQKSFDAQMHIIRDVHFDVDKYKVGEPYVINNTLVGIADTDDIKTFQGNKVIGRLVKVNKDSLIFEVPVYFKDPNTGGIYSFENITLSIDTIIDNQIEIERLMTETEAVVYLTSIIPKVCAEELIPKPIDEEPVLDEAKQSTLDPKDPKFNRLLGITPDYSQFPYTLERTHSYQELQAAYKINTPEEATEIAKNIQMNIVNDIMKSELITEKAESDSAVDTNIDRLNYICHIPGRIRGISFIKEGGSFACELFDRFEESIKVTLKSGETVISFRTSSKNITADRNTISMRNGNGTIKIVLHKDSFYKIFDEICFEG